MSDSGLKLSEETEREARERLAAQLERDADCWERWCNFNTTFRDAVVADLRRRAATLREMSPIGDNSEMSPNDDEQLRYMTETGDA